MTYGNEPRVFFLLNSRVLCARVRRAEQFRKTRLPIFFDNFTLLWAVSEYNILKCVVFFFFLLFENQNIKLYAENSVDPIINRSSERRRLVSQKDEKNVG